MEGAMPQMPQPTQSTPADMGGDMPATGAPEGGAPPQDNYDQVAQMAPTPDGAYSVQAIKTLVSQFNSTLEALAGGELPDVEWDPGDAGAKWQQPLPEEIFVPLMALDEALTTLAGSEMAKKYELTPSAIKTDADLRKASATLRMMEKDKKLAKIMQAPQQPATEDAAGAGGQPPAPMAENEDEVLQQNMA